MMGRIMERGPHVPQLQPARLGRDRRQWAVLLLRAIRGSARIQAIDCRSPFLLPPGGSALPERAALGEVDRLHRAFDRRGQSFTVLSSHAAMTPAISLFFSSIITWRGNRYTSRFAQNTLVALDGP